ncbi:MAG TPA: alpha/beta hydrolase domain-containing protein, partial [Chthoniobacterales bacterium]
MRRFFVVLVLAALAGIADAGVQRVEIVSRADVLDGKAFGDAGAYEKLIGKVHFAVKPEAAPNKFIVDLEKAPRNQAGEVEFSADFYVLRPKAAARSSGSVLLEIPNRGGKGILAIMHGGKGSRDPTTEEEFGDGFLMRRGVTVAWLGWQWDARDEANIMRLHAPRAREQQGLATPEKKGKTSALEVRGANAASDAEISRALSPRSNDNPPAPKRSGAAGGQPITGLVRADFTVNERQEEHPLGHVISGNIGGTEYACSDPQDPANVLTVRDAPMAARQTVARSDWQFVAGSDAKGEAARDLRAIRLKGGFEPGKIYEVVYRAQDPAIAGLGFAAVRDFASYLKRDGNELAPATQRVHALGISQSGRFLRHFLLEGFNADEAGQRAIDGMFIHVAGAGIGSFNHRFAQPSRDAQPTTARCYPTDLFPFTDAPQKEPETGKRAGSLDRAKAAKTEPKIFHTNTSYEYWSRAGSLIHTTPDGKKDVPPVENARIYLLTGLQHFSRTFPPAPETEPSLAAQYLSNPNPVRWFWRALFVAMDDWVRDGKAPPESRYPQIADGTLVRREALKFPEIPVFRTVKEMSMRSLAAPPERVHEPLRLDFGPQWKNRI